MKKFIFVLGCVLVLIGLDVILIGYKVPDSVVTMLSVVSVFVIYDLSKRFKMKIKPKAYTIKAPSFPMTRRQFYQKRCDKSKFTCHFPDDGCVHTTNGKGDCEWCKLFY